MTTEILVISSATAVLDAVGEALSGTTYAVTTAASYRDGMSVLARKSLAVILCDDSLGDGSWKDLLSHMAIVPEAPPLVVIATDLDATEASKLGAWDVVAKPLDAVEIHRVTERAVRHAAQVRA